MVMILGQAPWLFRPRPRRHDRAHALEWQAAARAPVQRPMSELPDDGDPARGIALGVVVGSIAWIIIGLLVWLLV